MSVMPTFWFGAGHESTSACSNHPPPEGGGSKEQFYAYRVRFREVAC